MEDSNGPVTNYRGSSASTVSPPNSYSNEDDAFLRYGRILFFVTVLGCVIFFVACMAMTFFFLPYGPPFQVDSFSISNLTFTNESRVFIVSEIHLTVRKPGRRVTLNYDRIVTSIYYKYVLLSQTGLSPFSLKPKNETSMVAKFAVEWNFVDKWVVDGINEEIGKNGNVGLDFWLVSSVNWDCKTWSYWSGRDVLKVSCKDLVVGIPSNGSPGGLTGPRSCRVEKGDIMKWQTVL